MADNPICRFKQIRSDKIRSNLHPLQFPFNIRIKAGLDQHSMTATGIETAGNIFGGVSHHYRTCQIDVIFCSGLVYQSGSRFATRTSVLAPRRRLGTTHACLSIISILPTSRSIGVYILPIHIYGCWCFSWYGNRDVNLKTIHPSILWVPRGCAKI